MEKYLKIKDNQNYQEKQEFLLHYIEVEKMLIMQNL
jgi:hypothetical protein